MIAIYLIINLQNNKVYVGQATHPKARIKAHYKRAIELNMSGLFYNAIRKYGWHNFTYRIIGTCDTRQEANKSEIECINFYDSTNKLYGYNLAPGGMGNNGLSGNKNPKYRCDIDNDKLCNEFENGATVAELTKKFKCHKRTIVKHIKSIIGKESYLIISKKNKSNKTSLTHKGIKYPLEIRKRMGRKPMLKFKEAV